MNKLEQLKAMTQVVADTGDVEAIAKYQPIDATTNPSLILKAVELPAYQPFLQTAKATIAKLPSALPEACQQLAVDIGGEIVKLVPGRVSSEVDARLSFDADATERYAREMVDRYAKKGISPERILIKIASTWEGIEAARRLERDGIQCNLTLLFGFGQAVACADAGVFLISPFVGRILDWHMAQTEEVYEGDTDPGVQSVRRIYEYYKAHDYQTVVMGASFRNLSEIEALAGCDRLTISPDLLSQLAQDFGDLSRRLTPDQGAATERETCPEARFRWLLNEDAMATEKLAEGIRKFALDQVKLESLLTGAV